MGGGEGGGEGGVRGRKGEGMQKTLIVVHCIHVHVYIISSSKSTALPY